MFAVDRKSGRLTLVEHQSTQGRTPRHIAIDPTGRWLLAENQASDSVIVFALDPDTGKLKPTGQSLTVGSPVCAVFVGEKQRVRTRWACFASESLERLFPACLNLRGFLLSLYGLYPAFVSITEEIQKRRTFAIISHPDAGKTTLTEKLLLYGGAVQLAGSVTARKNQRATTSDWMELEKKRGISISSTVLQFDYNGYRLNLLDTPGHKDFSEDTYRVLTAVDAVVMVIDAAKGIEPQTRKLFEVCRQRGVPIFTFMNKCDRPMRDPLALLDELERVLGIGAFPVNWPLGNGFEFQGVYDRQTKLDASLRAHRGGQFRAPVEVGGLHDPAVRGRLDDETFRRTVEELEMLEHAGHDWDDAAVLAEKTTPVFFGSASNNFGVQLLLDGFLKHSPPPRPRVMGGRGNFAGPPALLRFHLQDPGEHGPEASRPHRVRPRLLRQIRARHDGASLALRKEGAPLQLAQTLRQRTRDGGRSVSRRRHRPRRPRQLRHRRHAHDRSRHHSTRRSRASRPRPSATCTIRTRPSSSNSARAWSSSCRKASSRRFTCAIRR